MTIVLDGYNVIHGVPELERRLGQSLEAAREALIALCRAYKAARGDVGRLVIVFDGDEAYAQGPQADRGGVTVLFTRREEEADERILELIRADEGRSRFVIVSGDTYIFNNARVHGARMMPVSEFYAQARPASSPKARTARRDGPEKTSLSSVEAERITEEYRKRLEGGE